jgi:nucleoside-diphosphate-sugar epimerase
VGEAVRAAVEYAAGASSPDCSTFIVSSGVPVSMADVAEKVIAAMGQGQVVFQPSTRQVFDLCTSPAKARRELGWSARVSIDEIVKRVVATI